MSIALREGFANVPLNGVLEDLLVRFVINCPSEDLSSIERVFFQIEEAQWFYLDFITAINPSLPNLKMKGFSKAMIDICPLIWKWGDPSNALARFGKYKSTIPVRGVALFNESLSKVVLVQGIESPSWSFPRGKINKGEEDSSCAIRECREETGFDATGLLDEDEYVERTIHGKNYKIFLVKNVPEDYDFKPLVRNEIKDLKWRSWKKVTKDCKSGLGNSTYYLVNSMIKPITSWVNKQKGINDEENLKKYAESQLKKLLGIGESKKHFSEAKKQIDAGREILDMLHSHSTKEDTEPDNAIPEIFEKLLQPMRNNNVAAAAISQQPVPSKNIGQDQQAQPIPTQPQQVQSPYPLQYLVPFSFYPGIPVFAPPYQQSILQSYPQPQLQPQQTQIPHQPQLAQSQPQPTSSSQSALTNGSYLPVPNPGEFSKPSFSIAEITRKRRLEQSDSSKKELLSILNKPKSDDDEFKSSSSSEATPKKQLGGNPILDILQKKDDNNNTPIRATSSESSASAVSSPEQTSKNLLHLLQGHTVPTYANSNREASKQQQYTKEDKPAIDPKKINILSRPKEQNVKNASNDLLSILHGKTNNQQQSALPLPSLSPSSPSSTSKKITILKRGESSTVKKSQEQSSNDLLSILKKNESPVQKQEPRPERPTVDPKKITILKRESSQPQSEKSLLDILKGRPTESTSTNSRRPAESEKKSSVSQTPANDLLSIFNKPQLTSSTTPSSYSVSQDEPSQTEGDCYDFRESNEESQDSEYESSKNLLSILQNSRRKSPTPPQSASRSGTPSSVPVPDSAPAPSTLVSVHPGESNHELLNILRKPAKEETPNYSDGGNELLSILRNKSRSESPHSATLNNVATSNSSSRVSVDKDASSLSRSSSNNNSNNNNNNKGSTNNYGEANFMSILKRPTQVSGTQQTSGNELLSLLNRNRDVSPPPQPISSQSQSQSQSQNHSQSRSDGGSELLSILNKNRDSNSFFSTPTTFAPPPKSKSPVITGDNGNGNSNGNSGGNELLSILNRNIAPSTTTTASATSSQPQLNINNSAVPTASNDLLSILHGGNSQSLQPQLQQSQRPSSANEFDISRTSNANTGNVAGELSDDDLSDYIDYA